SNSPRGTDFCDIWSTLWTLSIDGASPDLVGKGASRFLWPGRPHDEADRSLDGVVELAEIGGRDVRRHVPLVARVEDVVDLKPGGEMVLLEVPRPGEREVECGDLRQPSGAIAGSDEVLEFVDGRPGESRPPFVERREHPLPGQAQRAAHDDPVGHVGGTEGVFV